MFDCVVGILVRKNIFFLYLIILVLSFNLVVSIDITSSTYNQRRIYEILFIAIQCFIILLSKNQLKQTIKTFFLLNNTTNFSLVIVIFLTTLSSFISAKSTSSSLMGISFFSLLFIIVIALSNYFRQNRTSYIYLILIFYLCILLYSLELFSNYFFIFLDNSIDLKTKIVLIDNLHSNFLFQNPRFLDNILSCIWCICLIPLLNKGNKKLKLLSFISTVLIFYIAIIHKGRTVPLEIITAIALSFFFYRKKAIKFTMYTIICFIVAFILFKLISCLVHFDISSFTNRELANSSGRVTLWKICFSESIEHPLLGIGMLNIPFYFDPTVTSGSAYPHSLFFTLLAENGIISTFLIFGIIIYGLYSLSKKQLSRYNPTSAMFFMALICILTDSMLSNFFIQPQSQLFSIGILAYCLNSKEITLNTKIERHHILFLRVFIIICLTIICSVTYYQLDFMSSDIVQNNAILNRLAPSFWIQGWLQTGY